MFSKEESIFLANLRSRMCNVKCNRKQAYTDLSCPLGCSHDDSQEKLLQCSPLVKKLGYTVDQAVRYSDI